MTAATEILKLIETVSPDDAAGLDEIDFHVEKYLGNKPYYQGFKKYTRSRNAIKNIRPLLIDGGVINSLEIIKGWGLTGAREKECREECGQYQAILSYRTACEKDGKKVFGRRSFWSSARLATEELAELHAVIQAIEFERGAGKHE